jgi:hypothetical protein
VVAASCLIAGIGKFSLSICFSIPSFN